MWLCLNDGFYSVVVDNKSEKDELLIRARRVEDIQKITDLLQDGTARILHTPKSDYQYRIRVSRDELKLLLTIAVDGIDYSNFKNSVNDDKLHSMYNRVWGLGVQYLDPHMPYRNKWAK